jgi:hypothetical protein
MGYSHSAFQQVSNSAKSKKQKCLCDGRGADFLSGKFGIKTA